MVCCHQVQGERDAAVATAAVVVLIYIEGGASAVHVWVQPQGIFAIFIFTSTPMQQYQVVGTGPGMDPT